MKLCPLNIRRLVVIAIGFSLIQNASIAAQSQNSGYKTFTNSIVPLPTQYRGNTAALNDETKQTKRTIHFFLEMSTSEELQARVNKGETLSPSEMDKYSADKANFDRLIQWLKTQGFTIESTSPDKRSVYASASIAQIEKSLGTTIVSFTYKGETTPNAITPPKLPNENAD
jgi:hypothetical protein